MFADPTTSPNHLPAVVAKCWEENKWIPHAQKLWRQNERTNSSQASMPSLLLLSVHFPFHASGKMLMYSWSSSIIQFICWITTLLMPGVSEVGDLYTSSIFVSIWTNISSVISALLSASVNCFAFPLMQICMHRPIKLSSSLPCSVISASISCVYSAYKDNTIPTKYKFQRKTSWIGITGPMNLLC